jgi:GPH family glycoside/pentoside/hexuronide:cation symporter
MILAMISDVLDHLEAKHGFRADGLTMSIYSSIMVAATPVGQAIFNLVSNSGQNTAMLSVCYIWLETVAFGLGAALMIFFGVEKHLESDQKRIRERQKAQAEVEGREWIEPEELLRRQEEEAERLAEEARKAELKVRCERKGLNFDEEERKYQEKLAKRKK